MEADIPINTRPATQEDKEFVYALSRAAYSEVVAKQFGGWVEPWQRETFESKWLAAQYRVVERSGEPIGAIWTTRCDDHVRLNEIVVLPEFQGRGIGSFLLNRELAQARELDLPVRLRVLKQNQAARRLYERLGFRLEGESDTHFLMVAC